MDTNALITWARSCDQLGPDDLNKLQALAGALEDSKEREAQQQKDLTELQDQVDALEVQVGLTPQHVETLRAGLDQAIEMAVTELGAPGTITDTEICELRDIELSVPKPGRSINQPYPSYGVIDD